MELKDFVSETLIQIIDGVKIAQQHASENGALINPRGETKVMQSSGGSTRYEFYVKEQVVKFNIAVTSEDTAGGKVKVGVFTGLINIDSQVDGGESNQIVNRIEFPVPLYLPPQIEQ